jgi:type II secretion system protein G
MGHAGVHGSVLVPISKHMIEIKFQETGPALQAGQSASAQLVMRMRTLQTKGFIPRYRRSESGKGFTLIELLVVIAIIGLLSSIVLASLNTARAKARDARRVSDLKQMQVALELYHLTNGSYPLECGNRGWGGHGSNFGDCNTNYIEGLTPYLSTLPIDPGGDNTNGYIYNSNGTDYKVMSYLKLEATTNPQGTPLGRCPSSCTQTYCATATNAAIYTPGAACW